MSEIYTAVKNIIIFMLLVTVFMNLLGKSSFKQYIRIFVGLVMILIVIRPILSLLNVQEKVDYYFDRNLYKINTEDMTEELYNAEANYQKKIVEEYKSLIEKQINTQLLAHDLEVKSLELEIESDTENESCGQILSIKLAAKRVDSQENGKVTEELDEVDQVLIDKITINDASKSINTNAETDDYDTVLEVTIKQELVSLYGVDINNISVTIEE